MAVGDIGGTGGSQVGVAETGAAAPKASAFSHGHPSEAVLSGQERLGLERTALEAQLSSGTPLEPHQATIVHNPPSPAPKGEAAGGGSEDQPPVDSSRAATVADSACFDEMALDLGITLAHQLVVDPPLEDLCAALADPRRAGGLLSKRLPAGVMFQRLAEVVAHEHGSLDWADRRLQPFYERLEALAVRRVLHHTLHFVSHPELMPAAKPFPPGEPGTLPHLAALLVRPEHEALAAFVRDKATGPDAERHLAFFEAVTSRVEATGKVVDFIAAVAACGNSVAEFVQALQRHAPPAKRHLAPPVATTVPTA